jgi:HEAT repeat protein
MSFPTHADARRAAARLLVQLRLSQSDEEWDEHLRFRVDLIRAWAAISDEPDEE